MEFTLESVLLAVSSFLLLVFWTIYKHHTKNYNYWKLRGVPYKNPVFPFGSVKDLILGRTYIGKSYDKLYKEFSEVKYFGIVEVQNPVLVLRDPELIKKVLVKDFNHFTVRTNLGKNPKEYILKHVINMSGQEWKDMRTLLTPAFTPEKMKSVSVLMEKCVKQLINHLLTETSKNHVIEVTNILARFTMDVIVTCAFGIETDSITNENCEFFVNVGALLRTTKARFFRRFLINFFPTLVKFLPVSLIPPKVTSLLTQTICETVFLREKNNVTRNDFLDILINTRRKNRILYDKDDCKNNRDKNEQEFKKGLTIEQMTAQAFVFFIAGYTTDTSVMTFCLYELSLHIDIQNNLYENVRNTVEKYGGLISYDAVQDMTYLDQIISETLRLYGSGQILIRTCTERYNIPESDIVLDSGVRVVIPTYSLHHDSKYFPDPYEFNPDRFTSENIKKRNPFVFLPFGAGPRNCIGRNFGLLQIKIGLANIIYNFQVNNARPEEERPIEIDKRSIVITPANPVFLTFTQRK